MHQLQRSWIRSQHSSAQWKLRWGRWSSAEYSTKKKILVCTDLKVWFLLPYLPDLRDPLCHHPVNFMIVCSGMGLTTFCLVCPGMGLTTFCLAAGLLKFARKDSAGSQFMMRGRILAQVLTYWLHSDIHNSRQRMARDQSRYFLTYGLWGLKSIPEPEF